MANQTVAELLVKPLRLRVLNASTEFQAIPSTESPTRFEDRSKFNGFTCGTKKPQLLPPAPRRTLLDVLRCARGAAVLGICI